MDERVLYLESQHGEMQRQIDQLQAAHAEMCAKNKRLQDQVLRCAARRHSHRQVDALAAQTQALILVIKDCTVSVEKLVSK